MLDYISNMPPFLQALIAGVITWLLTALGAATVFVFKSVNEKVLNSMQGFAAGIMIAASFWSLLQPAIESSSGSTVPWLPAAIGFLLGGVFIRSLDYVIPHMHRNATDESQHQEGVETSLNKNTLLLLAITLHNIPEGAALSLPIHASGQSKWKAFNYGQASALVEPVFATVGAAAVLVVTPILPYALAFAAGAMIFVVVEELIPDSQAGKNTDLATLSLMVGFTIMMILDVALG
ncbi:ZIP family metal transporter [Staphylococcus pseudintermedius]|nr:ZIP family metal transporter [Staphylococcus pseudintermedius]